MGTKNDRRENTNDTGIMLRAALQGFQSNVWTALPGIITKYDPVKMTCEVQPTIKARVTDAKYEVRDVTMPLLVDCPVIFPSGGGFTLTFPIKVDDECLVIFASRCIDSWWQSGGIQVQAELRMHNLSDGFVLPGPRSQPRVLSGVNADDVQLRNDAGTAFFSIKSNGDVLVKTPGDAKVEADTAHVDAPSGITLTGPVTIDGMLTVTGAATFDATVTVLMALLAQGTDLHNHQHGGVTNGNSKTSPPVNIVPPLP